jgi:hypothetical protein
MNHGLLDETSICERYRRLIRFFAYRYARRMSATITKEDLEQDGYVAVMLCLRRYGNKPIDELDRLIVTSIGRAIRRRAFSGYEKGEHEIVIDLVAFEAAINESGEIDREWDWLYRDLASKLDELHRRILVELVRPEPLKVLTLPAPVRIKRLAERLGLTTRRAQTCIREVREIAFALCRAEIDPNSYAGWLLTRMREGGSCSPIVKPAI